MAEALQQLGIGQGIVLYGQEGLDEAGLGAPTEMVQVENDRLTPRVLDPQTLGLTPAPLTALQGGDVEENAAILRSVLQGKGTLAQQEAVILNSAFALQVGQAVPSLAEGIDQARSILASGAGWQKVEELVAFLKG